MADPWGGSWGGAWGSSWGAGGTAYIDWLQETLAADGDWLDTPRTVTLRARSQVSGGTDVATSVTKVQREATTVDDLAFVPALANANSTVFNLWRSRLGGASPPRQDDKIDDGSVVWTIVLVGVLDEEQRYRCVCIRKR